MDRSDLDAQADQQAAAIRSEFAKVIESCERLRDLAFEMLAGQLEGRALQADAEALLVAVFCRSLDTYCASLTLAMDGYGTQAQMLNRSLFEDMVDAHWIATDPDAAIERYEQHAEHTTMLLADVVRKYTDIWSDVEIPQLDDARRKELDALYGPYGTAPWSKLNIYDRVAAIEHMWPDEATRRQLHLYRDLAQRDNNQMLHLSSSSLRATLAWPRPRGRIEFQVGPRTDRVDVALFGIFWTFAQTVGLMIDRFGCTMDDDERAALFSMRAFVTLTDEQMRDTGRNESCPCDSGLKFKRCHGA
ncbi:MAG: SEC-C domain-containing protein [Solirubrobacteraceae bacterium]|nr:SEC-C domain-containing protein [Solirubrobacteraceae bacterium]